MDYGDYRVPTDTVHVYNYAVPLYKNHLRNTAGREMDVHGSVGYITDNFKSVFYLSNIYTKSGFFANAHGLEPRNVDTDLHDKSSRDILMPNQEVTHTKSAIPLRFIGSHQLETQLGFPEKFRRDGAITSIMVICLLYIRLICMPRRIWKDNTIKKFFLLLLKINCLKIINTIGIMRNSNKRYNGWSFLIPAFKH